MQAERGGCGKALKGQETEQQRQQGQRQRGWGRHEPLPKCAENEAERQEDGKAHWVERYAVWGQ